MKRLLSLLYSGQIERWKQQVSLAIDSVVASGSAALATTQFLEASQVGPNALVALNTDLVLNTIVAQRDIPYNVATGVATLTAGRTYSLRAGGSMVNFAGGATFFDVTWVDATTNARLVSSVTGTWISVNENTNQAPSDAVEVLYTPTTNQTVKLRTVSGAGGTAEAVAGHFWAAITQVG